MQIPVTKDKDNKTELVLLDLDEVVYIQMEDRTVVYHTLQEKYYHLAPSLSVIGHHMQHLGFMKLDRTNLVNCNKVVDLDKELRIVYFGDSSHSARKSTTVSYLTFNKYRKKIMEWISSNLNSRSTPAESESGQNKK